MQVAPEQCPFGDRSASAHRIKRLQDNQDCSVEADALFSAVCECLVRSETLADTVERMNRSDAEIRKLQALVYGPSARATREDISRLDALQRSDRSSQGVGGVDVVSGDAATGNVAPGESSHRSEGEVDQTTPDYSVPPKSQFYRSRVTMAIAFGAVFVLGIGVGAIGVNASASSTPIAGVVPPNVDRFISETVTYFGEVDGVQVWTATLRDEDMQCLVASRFEIGGIACVPQANTTVSVDLAPDDDGVVRTVSLDFSERDSRPSVVVTPPQT